MRLSWSITGLLVAACVASCLADDRPVTQPAAAATGGPTTRPTTRPTTAPAESPVRSSGDPKVDEILDRLEAKGQAIKGLGCELTYRFVTVEPVEDSQTKEGELLFSRSEPNSQFLIHFTKMIADGIVIRRGEYFLFDGVWLTERNDKARTVIRRQIVREGQRVDPFKLGKGPFPLPFGQKRADTLRNFKVTLEPFALGDPKNTYHLHCVPRPNTELASKYSRVELYVDKKIELPVRIVTERLLDGNRIEVDFKKIDTRMAPAQSRFRIEVPDGYTLSEEPLPPLPDVEAAPPG